MKDIIILSAFLFGLIGWSQNIKNDKFYYDKDKQEIIAHIESIFQAFIDQDINKIRATHSNDWTGFQSSSKTLQRGIESYMENASKALETAQMIKYELLDLEVKVHGKIAVVFYLARIEFKLKNHDYKEAISRNLKSVDIYRKDKNGWIQAGSNITSFDPEK